MPFRSKIALYIVFLPFIFSIIYISPLIGIEGDLISYDLMLYDFYHALDTGIGSFSWTEPLFVAIIFVASHYHFDVLSLSEFSVLFIIFSALLLYAKTSGNNILEFIFLASILFIFFKYSAHFLLIKQTIATALFFLAIGAAQMRFRIFWMLLACLTHNMMIVCSLLYLFTLIRSDFIYIVGAAVMAIPLLISDFLMDVVNQDDSYSLSFIYFIVDSFLLFLGYLFRLNLKFFRLFFLLFIIVHFSVFDLLSIRFEFVLHFFRMLYVGLLLFHILERLKSSKNLVTYYVCFLSLLSGYTVSWLRPFF